MKQVVTPLALIGSLIIILSSFQFWHLFAMFLVAGWIPGTDIIATPGQMFIGIFLVGGFAVARIIAPGLRRLTTVKN